MAARWDSDIRGRGVADARRLVSGVAELVAGFGTEQWVAEEPEVHLLPHVQAWCERDQRLALASAHSDDSGAYVLDLAWQGPRGGVGEARAAVFALIGQFAESATYVRQRRVERDQEGEAVDLLFEVGTGELAGDTSFAPHGHVVLIAVAGVR